MADQVEIQIPSTRVNSDSSFTATAYFRDRATAAEDTPTTVEYAVDDQTTGNSITDWTAVSAAGSVSLSITSTENAIQASHHTRERRRLTVTADRGLSTEVQGVVVWDVYNVKKAP